MWNDSTTTMLTRGDARLGPGASHGSNVPGLETTATFDRAQDEFVIHTPTLTATKWWIGGAAHSATHAYVARAAWLLHQVEGA